MSAAMKTIDEFLKDLQDPTTSDGFWNVFNGLWGAAQCQPGYDHKAWLQVRDYVKKLESEVEQSPSLQRKNEQ